MKTCLRKRKAVSPVIAALLLIAICVAAAVITYSWVMTMIDDQGKNAQTAMRIDDVGFFKDDALYGVAVTVRNTGSVPTTIQTIYVYQSDIRMMKQDAIAASIQSGGLKSVGITTAMTADPTPVPDWSDNWDTVDLAIYYAESFTWEDTTGYTVKVVTDNGFIIEGTYWSPTVWPDYTG